MVRLTHADSLPRVGGIATMPSRKEGFARVLATILPQVDRLFVFFDKYGTVPSEVSGHPKIVALHPSTHGDYKADGKFLALREFGRPCLFFGFDDDIHYANNYVDRLMVVLARHYFGAVVGYHATMWAKPHTSYRKDRIILHYASPTRLDYSVDELGSGTIAFCSECISLNLDEWPHRNMADLMVAIEAVRQRVPKISARRPANWLSVIEEYQEDSLWRQLCQDDSRETAIMQEALRLYPGAWQSPL
jgi:hypothetical protein